MEESARNLGIFHNFRKLAIMHYLFESRLKRLAESMGILRQPGWSKAGRKVLMESSGAVSTPNSAHHIAVLPKLQEGCGREDN